MNKLSQPLILLAIVVCLNVIGSAFARVIVVKPSQDLAEIVARARPGTQILLAPGVFELKAKPPHQQCILIQKKKGLKISAKYPQKTVLRLSADAKFGFYIASDVEQLFISGLRIEG